MFDASITGDDEAEARIQVPASIVDAVIAGLRAGADAVLDRDWSLFTLGEKREAEQFARETFYAPADALERLRRLQLENPDQIG